MLEERKTAILSAVVRQYVETAQPVGSTAVARMPEVGVSSATVRNDFMVLEREGYLVQPHTSAGRVPTELGYRFFVDHLDEPEVLSDPQARQVSQFFARAHGELEHMLQETSRLLSNLTATTAMVVSQPATTALMRSVQLVALSGSSLLVVVVLSNGSVLKEVIEAPAESNESIVALAGRLLAEELDGVPASTVPTALSVPMGGGEPADPDWASAVHLAQRALDAVVELLSPDHPRVFVEGTSQIARSFEALSGLQNVLSVLEQQLVVVSLIRDVIDRGLNVAIGSETGLESLSDCAVVVAPVMAGDQRAGTIGVLGPTRMNYGEAMAAVATVSSRLGRALTEG